ncbi:hypothetical protein [Halogeometricum luteum]|uniref:Uncharacterized protein n=1 Tax=Halogeometricum luteum TaxID=2950537 RepID=A0ABU2G6Z0_9EURY|nr:hypothetical protein [Halogeometricum sp. S3BR5-2]MDS0296549.1 hypothetical protein [Halogeometricum sp. S3BR5-2]
MVAPEDHPIHDKPIPEYSSKEMNVPEVRESLQKKLTPLELQMFEDWRLDFTRWAFDRGKNERRGEGYSYRSMRDIINRVERFCEWLFIGKEVGKNGDIDEVIESEEGENFTVNFTPEHLNRYWYHLETNGNLTDSNRRTVNNVSLILKHQRIEWKIPNSEEVYEDIHREERNAAFKDWFRDYELKDIKSASLRLNIVDKNQLNEEEWNKRAVYLSQALGKPKYALSDEDWDSTVSWKLPSLVYMSCDL